MDNILTAQEVDVKNLKCYVVEGEELLQSEYLKYFHDESRLIGDRPKRLYLPKSTNEVIEAIRSIAKRNETIAVSGARTGVVGGSVPNKCNNIISTENISFISELQYNSTYDRWTIRVGAGTRLDKLNKHLRKKGNVGEKTNLVYPVDPTEKSASIGGNVSTNASGARSLFFRSTRHWVYGLTVILSDGSLLNISRSDKKVKDGKFLLKTVNGFVKEIRIPDIEMPDTKHSAGYFCKQDMDLIDLFIGSEGTLGVITEVELKLRIIENKIISVRIILPECDHLNLIRRFKSSSISKPIAIEFMDKRSAQLLKKSNKKGSSKITEDTASILFIEMLLNNDDYADKWYAEFENIMSENGLSVDLADVAWDEVDLKEMKEFRHALPEEINREVSQEKLKNPEITKIGTDMAVPESSVLELITTYESLLESNNLKFYIFGHIGDNHLHVNIVPKSMGEYELAWNIYKEVAEKVVKMKGSVAAEHGIGKLKKPFLKIQYPQMVIDQMINIKTQFDPDRVLNPDVLF